MSSHTLDLSGQRQMQLTMNDPAVTKLWSPAVAGDDASLSFSAREIRVPLGGNVRIEKRLATVPKAKKVDGEFVKVNGEYVYEDAQEERLVVVFPGSLSGFVRSSLTPDQRALPEGERPTYEQHTSTTVTVRRRKDDEWDWTEAGELVSEVPISELLALSDAWSAGETLRDPSAG